MWEARFLRKAPTRHSKVLHPSRRADDGGDALSSTVRVSQVLKLRMCFGPKDHSLEVLSPPRPSSEGSWTQ